MLVRRKHEGIDAVQWNSHGDHIQVFPYEPATTFEISPEAKCTVCGNALQKHGYFTDLLRGEIVCPGDWVLTDHRTFRHTAICKKREFEEVYIEVKD